MLMKKWNIINELMTILLWMKVILMCNIEILLNDIINEVIQYYYYEMQW